MGGESFNKSDVFADSVRPLAEALFMQCRELGIPMHLVVCHARDEGGETCFKAVVRGEHAPASFGALEAITNGRIATASDIKPPALCAGCGAKIPHEQARVWKFGALSQKKRGPYCPACIAKTEKGLGNAL